MFGAIATTVGKLFGTDKAISNVVDHASNALDKLVYTNEEKAEDKAKAASEARAMVIDWMKATSGQNLARRIIALIVTIVWVTQYVTMMILSVASVWVSNPENYMDSATVIGGYAERMNGAMMLVLAFYFAAPHMSSIVGGALSKFGGNKSN